MHQQRLKIEEYTDAETIIKDYARRLKDKDGRAAQWAKNELNRVWDRLNTHVCEPIQLSLLEEDNKD
jgi:hypothetical protein